jgi:hypothetical protein
VVNLDGIGNYSFGTTDLNLPAGTYDITAKASHWLREKIGSVVVSPTGAVGVNFSLINGDIDGDNHVDIGDYSELSTAFGSQPGDGNWNANADLDGDGEINIGDYAILSAEFGLDGDD